MLEDVKHDCPKCSESMEMGWIIDDAHYNFEQRVTHWKPGAPERASYFARLARSFTKYDVDALPIVAYRCEQCGFLEYYARPMNWPKSV